MSITIIHPMPSLETYLDRFTTPRLMADRITLAHFGLLEFVRRYSPMDPDERRSCDAFVPLLDATADPFAGTQMRPGHVTANACVVSRTDRRILLIRHPTLGRWMQPGGHLEAGDSDLAAAAVRAAAEETGLSPIAPSRLPFDLDVHAIPAEAGTPAHAHYDVRFLAVVDGLPVATTAERIEWRWFAPSELAPLGLGPSVLRMVEKARMAGLL